MKKFSKILIFALSLVIALSAFAIASSANSSPFLVEGLYRETWEEAIENAYIKGDRIVPVELLRDYEADGESVEITESVVISLNGHTLKSETGAPLFNVSGKDTTLTIVGPGTVSVNGTLANVESGTLVLDASKNLKVTSEGTDSAFVIGGEEKANVTVLGALNFESAGADLFEISAGSKFEIAGNNSINAKPAASATSPFGIALLQGNSKATVSDGGSLSNLGGYIFKVGEDADVDNPVVISCENATLISDSSSYGSIVEAGSGYAEVNIRLSEVLASGGAFTADDTLSEFEGEGRDKVYAKPTLTVNFTASTYVVSENENSNASLFLGNVTGIVTASEIWNSENSAIGIGTRLWDGECGVLVKYGCKISVTTNIIASELEAPLTDEDGVEIYFDPESTTNKNFSLDVIDGEPCTLQKTSELIDNILLNYCYVGTKALPFFDVNYSSNFEDSSPTPIANVITQNYGEISYPTITDADDVSNRFFKFEYVKGKEYPFTGGNAYFELDAGGSSGATRGFDALATNAIVTWDFDIATGSGKYANASMKMFIRPKTGSANYASYDYTSNFGDISGNSFMGYPLKTENYEWTHITLVLEMDRSEAYEKDGVTYYPNLYKSQMHFYANGQHQSTIKLFSDAMKSQDGIDRSFEFSLDSIRFNLDSVSNVRNGESFSTLIDNSVITYYPGDYVGDITRVLADKSLNLSEASDVVYKSGYYVPGKGTLTVGDRNPAAIVDGVNYYDMDEALAAISEGSEVRLYQDVEKIYNVKSSFTVYTDKKDGSGNYKFTVVSDGYYLSEIRENGKLLGYRTAPTNKFVTIFWQINNGYETRVPLGIAPEYDGVVPTPYADGYGRLFELVGWSTKRNATEPESIGAITKDDVAKGYKIYYPVYAPTKILVSFVDKDGNELYSDFYGDGEIPYFDGSEYFDGYEEDGKYTSVVGWSKNKDALEPDAMVEMKITNDDVLGSKIVYHPIDGISKVKVNFLNEKQVAFATAWVPVGTSVEELVNYNDGSSLPIISTADNKWFDARFTGWELTGGSSTVGTEPIDAKAVFDDVRIKNSAFKTSFSIIRLVDFSPTLFVLKPDSSIMPASEAEKIEFLGFSLDGVEALNGVGEWGNTYLYEDVMIGGNVYYQFNLATTKYPAKITSATLENFKIFVHYTYNGKSFTQEVSLSVSDYLDSIYKASETDAEKSTVLEIMRLIVTYCELAEKTDVEAYNVCKNYVNDSANKKYLSDYTKAIDSISDNKKQTNADILASLHEHFEDNIRWDFVNNRISVTPLESEYPRLSNAWTQNDINLDGIMIRAMCPGSGSKARLSNGLSGRTFTFTLSYHSDDGYKTGMITAYDEDDASDTIDFDFCDEYHNGRKVLFTEYYNLTAHITDLERRISEGETGLESELKMAQVILATQLVVESYADRAGTDISAVINTPAADLP